MTLLKDYYQYKKNPDMAGFSMLLKTKAEMKQFVESVKEEIKNELMKEILSDKEIVKEMMDNVREIAKDIRGITKGDKGDEAYTPQKGTDYFTEDEINEMVKTVQNNIRIPQDGKPGKNADETKIITAVLSKIKFPKGLTREEIMSAVELEITNILSKHKTLTTDDVKKLVPKIQKLFVPKENAEEIARALEILKGKEKLDYFALKNLPDIPKGEQQRTLHRGGQGLSVFSEPLSSQCNGVNKTFTVPIHTRALILIGTDAPILYARTTDFTTSGVTLTLTAAVNAPSSGATLDFLYAK